MGYIIQLWSRNPSASLKMVPKLLGFAFLAIISSAHCEESNRDARFSIFQIIKFANEPCEGGTRNGTCFTAQECEDQGGTDSGSCADGFGVCCSIVLTEGGSSSLNQSYMVQDASTTVAQGTMTYTICPCSSDVCRIRFDFTQFMLAGPHVPGDGVGSGTAQKSDEAAATGDCLTDTFSISGPNSGTPIICGANDGQHMIVDTDGTSCLTVNFGIGGTTGTSRNWDIMTTQYRCGEEAGGPPGCLQWHMEGTGSVRSFNFPRQARGAAVADTTTHLSNQRYSICIRRPTGTNTICYIPCTYVDATTAAAANLQQSFGLSIGPDAAAQSAVSVTECAQDYIEIIGGTSAEIAANGILSDNNMWCGRNFASATGETDVDTTATGAGAIAGASVCTASTPFRIRVNFDEDEWRTEKTAQIADSTADATADTGGEFAVRPGGIIGFSL